MINNWDYVGVAKAFDNGAGHVIASRVRLYSSLTKREKELGLGCESCSCSC